MRITLDEHDLADFIVKDGIFCGIQSKLIVPNHIGTKFTQKNKIFRSSIWSSDTNELLSGGLKKFVNFGENPDHFPMPLTVDNCVFVEKIDGSLTCIDYVNGQISMRTRGTFSIDTMENKNDFEYCLIKYPKVLEWIKKHSHYTLLCEITTPNLKIVLDYGNDPQFWLIGAVNKDDYSLMTQLELDNLGKELEVKRPESFSFNSMEELLKNVQSWTTREGICLYSKNSQEIHKIKAETYLKLHRFKENATLENTIELFMEYKHPSYQEFELHLQSQFDYECWNMIRGYASNICDAWKEVEQIINGMKKFVDETLKPLSLRKDQAIKVISSYSVSNRANMVFSLLDEKSLTQDQEKKLLYQCLKK